jgi:hypothetical protein
MKAPSVALLFALLAYTADAVRSKQVDFEAADVLGKTKQSKLETNRSSSKSELRLKMIESMGALVDALSKEAAAKQYPYGGGFDFGGWSAPAAPCNGKDTVIGVAKCLFRMGNGQLQNIFYSVAGADGVISFPEWKARVGETRSGIRW